jgi:hypothetical protein
MGGAVGIRWLIQTLLAVVGLLSTVLAIMALSFMWWLVVAVARCAR